MSLVQRLSEQLQQSLDANFKVTNVEAVLEIIKKLEGIPITKEQLETTRLAKFINGLRRQTTDDNLARRSKSLLRQWRALVIPTLAPTPQPLPTQQHQQPSASAASNSGSYFVNNISSIQQNGVSALGQPPGLRLPPKQQPLPTATLTISSASSSPLMPQQLQQQMGMAPTNRPYNGTNNSTTNQPQSQFLNQQPVKMLMGDSSGLLKQRQNQPMNCDNNSTNNSFLLSTNTTSDLSDNSQQSSRRNKSAKKEKKPKKSSGKDASNNNFPSITSFGGVITGDSQKPVQLNHDSLPTTAYFDGSNNSKSKASLKPAAARSLQQPFLFNGDSLSSSQSMSNFSFGAGGARGAAANVENLSFSGHFAKVKTNTTPTTFPQGQFIASTTPNLTTTAPISLVDDDDVVLINSSRSHSPFMPVTSMTTATTILNAPSSDPTPLEILVKESMTPVTTVVPVPAPAPEVKTPKKRGRKKGSKGIDSQLHLQNAINLPSSSMGSGGRDVNSYLDMKNKIDSMMPKTKKLKTTQELYAELQNKSKVASASTSTQVSPSSSSEQSLSTAVDSVASRMATPDPTSQDLFDASTSKGVRRNHVATVKQEKDDSIVKLEKPVPPPENVEDEIQRLMELLPPIDYRAAFEEDEEVARATEAEKCLCTMEVIEPDIVPSVEVEAGDVEATDVAVSITIPRIKPATEVMKLAKKEPPAPIKPQKQVKSIFDLDYDDDNDPIHDFRNSAQPEVLVVSAEEPPAKVEISVPVLPVAVAQPLAEPVVAPLDEPVIPAPPVFQVEYNIHPECPAMRIFETNPQNVTKFHLDALHHQFVPNVNGNWSNLPIYVPSITKSDPPDEKTGVTSDPNDDDDKLFDRVVPPYNFLHYEPIPKTHPSLETGDVRESKLKMLLREQFHRRQRDEADMKTRERKRKANHSDSEDDGLEEVEDVPASKRVKLNDNGNAGQNVVLGGDANAEVGSEDKEEIDEEEIKRQKLKELQQSMALSSFLDPNYNFYYNDQAQQQELSLAEHTNVEEVAVPFENNNLNLRINAVSDVNSERVTEMLRMTIDDDVDIRNEHFFSLKLAPCSSSNNNRMHAGGCQNGVPPPSPSSSSCEDEPIVQNGCSTTTSNDMQTSSKPDIKYLVMSQMGVRDEAVPFVPLSSLELAENKHSLAELVQHLDPVMSDTNNGLLPSFDNIEFDVPALTSVPPTTTTHIKQEPGVEDGGADASSTSERYFREWQDCLNVRSYNDEVITLLPYVVID